MSGERVRTLADVYACADQAYVEALAEMADLRVKGWWEDYAGKIGAAALDLAELEHHACALRNFGVAHLPGLLQTEEYARAVFGTAIPEHLPAQLRLGLSFRMRRRDVLDRDDPPQCTFLVHELALRLDFGGPAVMRLQLNRLLEASERPGIEVRAIPIAAGGFAMVGASSIEYADGPVPQLDTVVYDTATGAHFLDAPAVLDKYRTVLRRMERIALSRSATRDFVSNIVKQL
ncbi:DUF5753 domain-containing protein [Streptomyces sp. DSM 44917]|uniref:DUF5753 domain-containing protein n=1 Tax=Streptomyces boetiae TaxID=3075541 RepID=A0ABU2L1E9_9ACTN|nr:DUF5753 domain-containing protein [Streptomyces sp. DSM 44917]MDT0305384.1 DUF5753 domain-containing protein [Streptomyces sp. DSM 44917]